MTVEQQFKIGDYLGSTGNSLYYYRVERINDTPRNSGPKDWQLRYSLSSVNKATGQSTGFTGSSDGSTLYELSDLQVLALKLGAVI